jgi:hypothetical protein
VIVISSDVVRVRVVVRAHSDVVVCRRVILT